MPYKGTDPERLAANRQYRRNHYYKNPEPYIARAKERNKVKRAELRVVIDELKSQPCTDCGRTYPPYVMDYDHRDPSQKVQAVSRMVMLTRSIESILKEIEKCDLVCSNCHRIRTFGQSVESGAGTPRSL